MTIGTYNTSSRFSWIFITLLCKNGGISPAPCYLPIYSMLESGSWDRDPLSRPLIVRKSQIRPFVLTSIKEAWVFFIGKLFFFLVPIQC
ncbi:unnamed protein product, partial [Vitis vinifera]|uniref:Uncharacterized protein n=1 Tax=Vitis vinifera TaxID=29760 RepID=D7TZB6_VITVI